jgi:hypothetical protein
MKITENQLTGLLSAEGHLLSIEAILEPDSTLLRSEIGVTVRRKWL